MSESATGLDFSARYTVSHMPGVALWLKRYATTWSEAQYIHDCAGVEYHDTEGECTEACYLYDEPEEITDTDRVIAVMAGDNTEHAVDVSDLTAIPADGYCRDCGQTGCTSNVYD
jgi:hypothetical protein